MLRQADGSESRRAHLTGVRLVLCGTAFLAAVGYVPATPAAVVTPDLRAPASSGSSATSPVPWSIVFELDVTKSVPLDFRKLAQEAFADALLGLVVGGRGPITVYWRLIVHNSGPDSAAVPGYPRFIPAVRQCPNPFDSDCRRAQRAELSRAMNAARAIAADLRSRRFPTATAGSTIRGAIAAGGRLLRSAPGVRWLIMASDMRPSNSAPPQPEIDLSGVHVRVLLSCREPIAVCQERERTWSTDLAQTGRASLKFLAASQGGLLFRRSR